MTRRVGSGAAWGTGLMLAWLSAGGATSPSVAEETSPPPGLTPGPASVRAVVGEQYRASGFHRWLWGSNYRDLYTTPVELPVRP